MNLDKTVETIFGVRVPKRSTPEQVKVEEWMRAEGQEPEGALSALADLFELATGSKLPAAATSQDLYLAVYALCEVLEPYILRLHRLEEEEVAREFVDDVVHVEKRPMNYR